MNQVRTALLLIPLIALILPPAETIAQRIADRPLVSSSLFRQPEAGTGFSIFLTDSTDRPPVRARGITRGLLIVAKFGLGGVFGVFLALPVGYVSVGLSGAEGWAALGPGAMGAAAGYLLGSALGVHVISEGQNAETDYLTTLAFGAAGMVVGVSLLSESDGGDVRAWAPFVLPIVFEIVYTELIE